MVIKVSRQKWTFYDTTAGPFPPTSDYVIYGWSLPKATLRVKCISSIEYILNLESCEDENTCIGITEIVELVLDKCLHRYYHFIAINAFLVFISMKCPFLGQPI